MTGASLHFAIAALNVLAVVMLADNRDRGALTITGIVLNSAFALANIAHGFQKVLA